MAVEGREQVTRLGIVRVNGQPEELDGLDGRRQPSMGGTSRVSREAQARICERLGVKFPGATRRQRVTAVPAAPSPTPWSGWAWFPTQAGRGRPARSRGTAARELSMIGRDRTLVQTERQGHQAQFAAVRITGRKSLIQRKLDGDFSAAQHLRGEPADVLDRTGLAEGLGG